jgi:hypothetical protein
MSNARPDSATEMIDPTRPHAEVIDPTTRKVWQSIEPCDADELGALDLPEPLRPVGIGNGAMDEHWFDRSPGAPGNGPMEERVIDGRRFGHCACPASIPAKPFGEDGPIEMIVDKYHAMRFAAGRRVAVLKTPEGEAFVHVIDGQGASSIGLDAAPRGSLVIPEGCSLGEIALEKDWILRLPHPTRVFFFPSGDSFQGPIDSLPAEWDVTR